MTHRQQHRFPAATMGSEDRTPMTIPPITAGCRYGDLVVVLTAKMRDELLALEIAQRVLQLHQLDEQVVLRIEAAGVDRTLEVERQPLLDAMHAGALGKIEEQRDVEDDRRR